MFSKNNQYRERDWTVNTTTTVKTCLPFFVWCMCMPAAVSETGWHSSPLNSSQFVHLSNDHRLWAVYAWLDTIAFSIEASVHVYSLLYACGIGFGKSHCCNVGTAESRKSKLCCVWKVPELFLGASSYFKHLFILFFANWTWPTPLQKLGDTW